jgi:hypothetical protein
MSGSEFVLEEDKIQAIYDQINSGAKLIVLENNNALNISSIESIIDIPKIAKYKNGAGNIVDPINGQFYIEDGKKIKIDFPEKIYYIENPKYKAQYLELNGKNI